MASNEKKTDIRFPNSFDKDCIAMRIFSMTKMETGKKTAIQSPNNIWTQTVWFLFHTIGQITTTNTNNIAGGIIRIITQPK